MIRDHAVMHTGKKIFHFSDVHLIGFEVVFDNFGVTVRANYFYLILSMIPFQPGAVSRHHAGAGWGSLGKIHMDIGLCAGTQTEQDGGTIFYIRLQPADLSYHASEFARRT